MYLFQFGIDPRLSLGIVALCPLVYKNTTVLVAELRARSHLEGYPRQTGVFGPG
jgi:hypothetical protein